MRSRSGHDPVRRRPPASDRAFIGPSRARPHAPGMDTEHSTPDAHPAPRSRPTPAALAAVVVFALAAPVGAVAFVAAVDADEVTPPAASQQVDSCAVMTEAEI